METTILYLPIHLVSSSNAIASQVLLLPFQFLVTMPKLPISQIKKSASRSQTQSRRETLLSAPRKLYTHFLVFGLNFAYRTGWKFISFLLSRRSIVQIPTFSPKSTNTFPIIQRFLLNHITTFYSLPCKFCCTSQAKNRGAQLACR